RCPRRHRNVRGGRLMIDVPGELAAAIETHERRPLIRVSVDWDGDGHGPTGSLDDLTPHVGTVTIDRTLAGELPAEVTIAEGSAAASLDADLTVGDPAEERRHAAWWFSRANESSPLAGKERLGRDVYAE